MNRAALKDRAKGVLKKHYLILFVVSLLVALLGGNLHDAPNGTRMEIDGGEIRQGMKDLQDEIATEMSDIGGELRRIRFQTWDHGVSSTWGYNLGPLAERQVNGVPFGRMLNFLIGVGVVGITLAVGLCVFLFAIFVAFPVKVGGSRIFIDTADGAQPPMLSKLGFAFRAGRYGNTVKAGFFRGLYTFLWSLLFIIPGVVKGYAYSMVPYILADNPEMNAHEALRLSEQLTRGHKWELFKLDVSFMGWYILGSLAFGVGKYLVNPYADATKAQAYLWLRYGAWPTAPSDIVDVREDVPHSN